eukprot:CAMPEP_0172657214 /NCGR_PEP_ID=MMETSP1074-20121228/1959_1 /TAXON_ID=2916 /ORGANISM="Ceratium fusus, Strain PA161109" /LENGTH=71 /DNA_ID=CAMNT_0013472269 /DNA_START=90 /DNA_END=302 /DNA_ORIENTATION=+
MYRSGASLACCQQTGHNHITLIPDDLRLPVRWNSAHVVMHSGQHWCWLFRDIDACEDLGCLRDAWKALGQR